MESKPSARSDAAEAADDAEKETRPTRERRVSKEVVLSTLAPFVVSAAFIQLLGITELDVRIVEPFYDRGADRWPLSGSGFVSDVLHRGGRYFVFSTALVCVIVGGAGGLHRRLRPWRRRALLLGFSIALSAGFVALLKSESPDPAPWNATAFGGVIEHRGFFQSASPVGAHGHNSPGAHASGAFAFMATYFWWRRQNPRRAWFALAAGWALGQTFGLAQVARGAHFPSHNQWSCIVAWTACLGLYWVVFRGRVHPGD